MAKPFVRQVFELRYEALFQFFDHRSELLARIFKDQKTKEPNFVHWQLRENRVDFFDADQVRQFFVAYNNCGFQCENPPSENYAKDQILKYVTAAFEVVGDDVEKLHRIGFREIRVFPVSDLQKTKKLLREAFVRTDTSLFQALDARLDDFTLLPLVFKQGDYQFQITLGPATTDEILARVGRATDLPDAGLYMDVDYYSLFPEFKTGWRSSVSDFLNRSQTTISTIREQLIKMQLY